MTTQTTPAAPDATTTPAAVQTPPAAPAVPADAARIAALESQLAAVETALLAEVPPNLKALVPSGLPIGDRIGWIQQAKASGLFNAPTAVPTTDVRKSVSPMAAELAQLPPTARMAAAYGSAPASK